MKMKTKNIEKVTKERKPYTKKNKTGNADALELPKKQDNKPVFANTLEVKELLKPLGDSLAQQIKDTPEVIDSIKITEGKNSIRISMTKCKNRSYRIQIFLNDREIRNSTYTGTNPAMNVWELMKGNLK